MSINLLFTNPEVPLIPMNVSTWNSFSTNTSTLDIVGTANQIDVVTLGGTTTISLDDKINTPGDLNVSGILSVNSSYGFPNTIGADGQCLSVTGTSPTLIWSNPQSILPNNVTINSSLNVGATNADGSFVFDANGNLTLPLNSNGNGSTFIRAGDNSGTSTNTIDMFCNWNSNTGVYGGECYLSNSQAYIGIDGVSNSVTNYVGVDNTSNPNSGTFKAQVVSSTASSTLSMDTSSMLLSIPKCNILLDNTSYSDAGVIALSSFNTVNGTTSTITYKNDTQDGGLLSVGDLAATNINVNGAYNLATTDGSPGSVLTAAGNGTTSWVAPGSVGASYCCVYNIPGQNTGTNPAYALILNTGTAVKTNDYTVNVDSITLQPNSVYKVDWSFSFVQFVATTVVFDIQSSTAGIVIGGTKCEINTSGQPMSSTGIIITGATASPTIQLIIASLASTATFDVNSICITKI